MLHLVWRFLGWFIAIAVGAGATIWVYKKQSYKAVTYQVVSMTPLVREARGFGDLKVQRGDKVIEEPFLITIRLTNAGDVHITPADFAEPLELRPLWGGKEWLDTGSGSAVIKLPLKSSAAERLLRYGPHIADARVAETTPSGIRVQLAIKPEQVQIQPLLLNAGDQIVVEMLISGNPSAIQVNGRVAGVKQITEDKVKPPSRRFIFATTAAVGGLIAILVLVMLLWIEARVIHEVPKRAVRVVGILISFLMGIFAGLVTELLR